MKWERFVRGRGDLDGEMKVTHRKCLGGYRRLASREGWRASRITYFTRRGNKVEAQLLSVELRPRPWTRGRET